VPLDPTGRAVTAMPSCGLRIVESRHPMPISVFVRDAVRGGCSVVGPPDDPGFRLVREASWYARLAALARLPWR
jgi:hypothetical protein